MERKEQVDWYKRFVESWGPDFRIEVSNPQMGYSGEDVYRLYGSTKDNNKGSIGLSQSGKLNINSDVSIEIVAGEKNGSKGEDIIIHSRRGNVSITCERTGAIKIQGHEITIESQGDLNLSATKEIRMKGDAIIMEANTATAEAINGNLAPEGKTFLDKALEGTFVGNDVIKNNLKRGC